MQSQYDDDIAKELHKRAQKIAVQMKVCTFSGKVPMSVIVFLQEFKSVCYASGIHGSGSIGLSKKYRIGSAKSAVEERGTL